MDFVKEKGRIFIENEEGNTIAEIRFPEVADGVVNINRTFVDSSLRGHGIASKLMEEAVKDIEGRNMKAKVDCSYARKWAEKHPEKSDLFIF